MAKPAVSERETTDNPTAKSQRKRRKPRDPGQISETNNGKPLPGDKLLADGQAMLTDGTVIDGVPLVRGLPRKGVRKAYGEIVPVVYMVPYRPEYEPAIGDEICNRLAAGESLRSICALPGMPQRVHVYHWLWTEPAFADQYGRARDAQMEAWADEALEIADDSKSDVIISADGEAVTVWENVQRSKLRVETRKWFMARMAPKRFSERVITESTNTNLNLNLHADVQGMTREEKLAEARRIADQLGVGKRDLGDG